MKIQTPIGLDWVDTQPLWTCQVLEYIILCGLIPSGVTQHWLCQFTGSLMAEGRRLEILANIDEWKDFKFPEAERPRPKPKPINQESEV